MAWALGFLPLAYFVNWVAGSFEWAPPFLVVSYVAVVPAAFRFLYPWLLKRAQDNVHLTLPPALRALSCLRTGAIAHELQNVLDWLHSQHPIDHDPDDLFIQLLDYSLDEINHCISLANLDPDTIWSEIEEDPEMIEHYLRLDSTSFTENDVEVVGRYLRSTGVTSAKAQIECVSALGEVAVSQPDLRSYVLHILDDVISADTDEAVKDAATQAHRRITNDVTPPQPAVTNLFNFTPRRVGIVAVTIAIALFVLGVLVWQRSSPEHVGSPPPPGAGSSEKTP